MRVVGRSPSIRSIVKGSFLQTVRACPPVLREGLVNESCREEPVCLKYSEGLVFTNSESLSACVEGRARQ